MAGASFRNVTEEKRNMDRRLLSVLGMSVVLALVVAGIFYQVSSHASAAPAVATKDMGVAGESLPLGLAIKPNHVKVVKVPVTIFPKTPFTHVDDVLARPGVTRTIHAKAFVDEHL